MSLSRPLCFATDALRSRRHRDPRRARNPRCRLRLRHSREPDGGDRGGRAPDRAHADGRHEQGRPGRGQGGLHVCGVCRLPHLQGRRLVGDYRARPRHGSPGEGRGLRARVDRRSEQGGCVRLPAERHAGHIRRVAFGRAARRPRRLPDAAVELTLPSGFPRNVEVLACDLDRTLIAKDGMLPPRTEAAIRAARAAGIRVVIATGRMFVSARPYVLQAGIDDPVVCYQGAVVAEPETGRWLRHEPIPVALAKEAIEAIVGEGFHCNVYVDDELFVGKVTPEARAYADFQGLVIHEVGDLAAWLEKPATKVVSVGEPELLDGLFAGKVPREPRAYADFRGLVTHGVGDLAAWRENPATRVVPVGEPELLDGLEARLKELFPNRLYISKSLPFFLEIASPKVTK